MINITYQASLEILYALLTLKVTFRRVGSCGIESECCRQSVISHSGGSVEGWNANRNAIS